MREPDRIAILVSDLHLTMLQPACRADKDWMRTQLRYLDQLKAIAGDLLPIICAGDVFDKWNPPNELVHFALRHLPTGMFCVPGQHDLPNHRADLMHRSGYGVLKEAGKIRDLPVEPTLTGDHLILYGFGWGQKLIPPNKEMEFPGCVNLAVIHHYCWEAEHSYPGAPADSNVTAFAKQLRGYHAAVFGDNHKGFISKAGKCNVINTGGFIRRKSDEIDYEPQVGVLFSDGTIKRRRLDTSWDTFHKVNKAKEEVPLNLKAFLENLEGLGEHGLDFRQAVEHHLRTDEIDTATKEIILKALESK